MGKQILNDKERTEEASFFFFGVQPEPHPPLNAFVYAFPSARGRYGCTLSYLNSVVSSWLSLQHNSVEKYLHANVELSNFKDIAWQVKAV
jgi:hypothetical protein